MKYNKFAETTNFETQNQEQEEVLVRQEAARLELEKSREILALRAKRAYYDSLGPDFKEMLEQCEKKYCELQS